MRTTKVVLITSAIIGPVSHVDEGKQCRGRGGDLSTVSSVSEGKYRNVNYEFYWDYEILSVSCVLIGDTCVPLWLRGLSSVIYPDLDLEHGLQNYS